MVTEIGGGLRELTVAGRHLVQGFPAGSPRPLFRGSVLAPWPNRVADGRYRFAGIDQQLALTEPDRGHALHGLACWSSWQLQDRTSSSVLLATRVGPQAGWPHLLDLVVGYSLTPRGLRWSLEVGNAGPTPAPWGCGVHPYLRAGAGRVDDWDVQLDAVQVLQVDERLLPRELTDVAGTELDLRRRRPMSGLALDHAYTGLGPGRASVTLRAPEGTGVAMSWAAGALPWVQLYTCDRPDPREHRVGLAVEPMTCPPDAFNSGAGLIVLQPAERRSWDWEIVALPG